jgi:hypothetical protein
LGSNPGLFATFASGWGLGILLPQPPEFVAVFTGFHRTQTADQRKHIIRGEFTIVLPLQSSRINSALQGSHGSVAACDETLGAAAEQVFDLQQL